jgi:hypothetical protein
MLFLLPILYLEDCVAIQAESKTEEQLAVLGLLILQENKAIDRPLLLGSRRKWMSIYQADLGIDLSSISSADYHELD